MKCVKEVYIVYDCICDNMTNKSISQMSDKKMLKKSMFYTIIL